MSGEPKAWFLVAAPTRDEALWVADQLGSIDTRSLHEVKKPFAIDIGSHASDDGEREILAFGKEDANVYWTDSKAVRWATELARKPLEGEDSGMIESANESAARQHDVGVKRKRGDVPA